MNQLEMESVNCPENPSENVTIDRHSGHLKIKYMVLTCIVDSNPKPRFDWFFNGTRLELEPANHAASSTSHVHYEVIEGSSSSNQHQHTSQLVIKVSGQINRDSPKLFKQTLLI